MAIRTDTVTAHMDRDTKRKAEDVFKELRLTASQAITLFYQQVCLERRLPFAAKIGTEVGTETPNQITVEALEEAAEREQLPRFESPEALYEDLEI